MLKRLICAIAAAIVLAGTAGAWSYPDKVHEGVDYADMECAGYDETALCAVLDELEGLDLERMDDARWRRVDDIYHQIEAEINVLETQAALIGIWYDASGGCAEAAEAQRVVSEQETRLFDRCYKALALLCHTPYENVLNIGRENAEALGRYGGLTDAMPELYMEEDRLEQAYDQVMAGAESEPESLLDLSETEREAGEIYRELVEVRTRIAEEAGYGHYGDYAYWNSYSRDYTLDDIRTVREAVKERFVPLLDAVAEGVSSRNLRALELRGRASGEEILDALGPFLESVHPALLEAYQYLREYHLYDIEYSGEKLPTGYTVALPAYGTAFLFNSPYGDYQDYSDAVHEFGHFNETFHSDTHPLWEDFNIDVGEIHSQTLELLFTDYADEVFGDLGDTYRRVILYNLISSVVDGCLYDEFQAEVYENPEMELEEINRLFKELSEEYGYYYPEDQETDGSWVQISHTFQSPMYYISYATSALSSLDLWLRAQSGREEAIDTYMDLTALSMSKPYREAVYQAGLTNIFRRGGVEDIGARLEAYLEGREVPEPRGEWGWFVKGTPDAGAAVLVLLVIPVFVAGAAGSAALLRRGRRRERVEPFTYPDRKPPWEF